MSKRVRVKPSKGQSAVGFFAGLIFCFIGLFIVIPTFGPFGFLWTLFAIVITVMNGINAFSDKGIATHEIDFEDIGYKDPAEHNNKSSEERLHELKSLYDKNMITYDEYQMKRKKILEEI